MTPDWDEDDFERGKGYTRPPLYLWILSAGALLLVIGLVGLLP